MKHYLINITNLCQLKCSYCWVRRKVNKVSELDNAVTRPYEDWVKAIRRDPPEVLDVGGGEPLSVDWCIDLIKEFPNIQ
jgi:MoaA/NifB/PqqE/SkfB family radical SAM enzyme